MNRRDIIWHYQDLIKEVYKEENLHCLRGDGDSYLIKGKEILLWHSQVTRRCMIKFGQFDQFKNVDDLLLRSDEVMHFTAQLFLYRPFINNPISDAFSTSTMTVYPNNQNLEAKRYYMYADIVSEKLYSYWHRIGDMIAAFFPNLIKPDRVYFATAFDIIPKEFHDLEGYKWLKDFRENAFKQINGKRKEIVHYTSSDTDLKYKHLFTKGSKEEIEKWIEERNQIPDFFRAQLEVSIEGFYQTLSMLQEIDKVVFKDIT